MAERNITDRVENANVEIFINILPFCDKEIIVIRNKFVSYFDYKKLQINYLLSESDLMTPCIKKPYQESFAPFSALTPKESIT